MSFRDSQKSLSNSIYATLGADISYQPSGGAEVTIKARTKTEQEYGPAGLLSTVQENETVYYVRKADVEKPVKGDLIQDESQLFEVLRHEPRNRYEWLLITREVITHG